MMGQLRILEDDAVEDSKEEEADKKGAEGAAVGSEVDWLDVFLLDITILIGCSDEVRVECLKGGPGGALQ
ncbi:hypothetical protein MUK42_28654 [Musa troglodytarum]|uniref:Uncharacterized protein n=1 Tax=Musa troglodytarum TaxID=320322 RepID=A0A9E7FGF5_9LILI|nr:hypothetical protein MUK42_28654 [Musa troglodytarum]